MCFFLLCLLPGDDRHFFATEHFFKPQGLGQLIQPFTLPLIYGLPQSIANRQDISQ